MILFDDIKYIYNNELIPVCTAIKNEYNEGNDPSSEILNNLNNILNKIVFDSKGNKLTCLNVYFTRNTDKMMFGIKVDPIISAPQIITILLDQGEITFKNYSLEIDSKILDHDISGEEFAAYIIEEIYSVMDPQNIERVKDLIAELIAKNDDSIKIRNSINYSQIIIFAFKHILSNVASLIYKDEDAIGMLNIPNQLEIKDTLMNCRENLCLNLQGILEPESMPSLGILQWALMVYDDIKLNIRSAQKTLMDARMATGSVLEIKCIDDTLKSLERAFNEVITEATNLEDNYLSELSLFKSLKTQGLKSIEADLYEYKLQAKNCVEQEEALFIIRQINTRIGIIEDYLASENISDAEKNKWTAIDMEYRELRQELAKKKLSMRKNVGYYVDYDALDKIE